MAHKSSVIIIGAGFAGLAAAQELRKHPEVEVIVLEARDRVGGRVTTDFSLGVPFDRGAFIIHGSEDNPMVALAQQAHATFMPTSGLCSVAFNNNAHAFSEQLISEVHTQYDSLLEKAGQHARSKKQDYSLERAIAEVFSLTEFPALTPELLAWRNLFQGLYGGADIKDVSAQHWEEDETPFEGDHLFMTSGYQPIIDLLAKSLNIQFNTAVTAIHYQQQLLEVKTNQGTFTADKILITLPLGVLKKEMVVFNPPLPTAKLAAIQHLGMGLLEKIALKFPKDFWPAKRIISPLSCSDSSIGWFINYHYHLNEPILVGSMAGDLARACNKLDDEALIAQAMKVLKEIFGKNIPAPTHYIRTCWENDPASYGSYSFIPIGATGKDYDCLSEPVQNRLFFAGEATNRQYPGTTHGAYLSGIRAANQIMHDQNS